jgi:hypothetical protein
MRCLGWRGLVGQFGKALLLAERCGRRGRPALPFWGLPIRVSGPAMGWCRDGCVGGGPGGAGWGSLVRRGFSRFRLADNGRCTGSLKKVLVEQDGLREASMCSRGRIRSSQGTPLSAAEEVG